ncbi:hypothetical protein EV148_11074 [Dokdonella fugitiva]|uniref:RiboL-PSP-HEPN domain-containing protein n=1 Tax=Dokdonella fugitiva TaxID=328517 RepID=A0A4R2HZW3_9GAMM|nr:hypothetical protein EV148_11074 [Dokdonella fugitiva]
MTWHRYSIWDDWKEWTQFLALVDYSLESSASVWKSLPVKDRDQVTLIRTNGGSKFTCPGDRFLPTLESRHTVCTLLILSSYALIEGHVEEVLSHAADSSLASVALVNDFRNGIVTAKGLCSSGGIEKWGTTLLSAFARDWTNVHGGKAGAVEVATVRNALAHGRKCVTTSMVNRVSAAGGALPWSVGDPITLDMALTSLYRNRLRSFARVVGTAAHVTAYP